MWMGQPMMPGENRCVDRGQMHLRRRYGGFGWPLVQTVSALTMQQRRLWFQVLHRKTKRKEFNRRLVVSTKFRDKIVSCG